ncbi:MAG: hypothetical protein ACREMQ_05385 [Longimicrobiales bacterium]
MLRCLSTQFIACIIISACTGEGPATDAVVRDSAGITIVENTTPAWGEGGEWRLGEVPDVTIGDPEGAVGEQLFRVSSVVAIRDGRIAVANGGTREIRFFDSQGRFLAASGRDGDGPGEYRVLSSLFRYGADSLLVYDSRARRASVLTAAGDYARSFTLLPIDGHLVPRPGGVFGDRTLFVLTDGLSTPDGELKSGPLRQPMQLFRTGAEGALLDSLGFVLGSDMWVRVEGSGDARLVTFVGVPFGRFPATTVAADRFFSGDGERYHIAVRTVEGKLERLIRWDRPNRPVMSEDVENMKRSWLANARDDNMRRRISMDLAELPIPPTMPAHGDLHADAEGNLWVQVYRARGEDHTRWIVFDRQGRLLGPVRGPARFTTHEIGADFVIGVRTDELDVERVERYHLMKSR